MVNGKPRIYNAEIRYAEKMDEAIRSTTVDSVINDFRANHKSTWDKIQGKIGEEGLRFVIMADKVVRASGWNACLLYTSPSPRDGLLSRMPSSA